MRDQERGMTPETFTGMPCSVNTATCIPRLLPGVSPGNYTMNSLEYSNILCYQ